MVAIRDEKLLRSVDDRIESLLESITMEKEKKLAEITERLAKMVHETSPYSQMIERKKQREAERIEAERLEA